MQPTPTQRRSLFYWSASRKQSHRPGTRRAPRWQLGSRLSRSSALPAWTDRLWTAGPGLYLCFDFIANTAETFCKAGAFGGEGEVVEKKLQGICSSIGRRQPFQGQLGDPLALGRAVPPSSRGAPLPRAQGAAAGVQRYRNKGPTSCPCQGPSFSRSPRHTPCTGGVPSVRADLPQEQGAGLQPLSPQCF